MLSQILKDELKQRDISAREAGRQSGVAHTTIIRILEGRNVDLETVKTIGKWLKIDVSNLLNSDNPDKKSIAPTIATFLDKNPRLKFAFMDVISQLQNGEIENHDLDDILAYITFRLDMFRKKN